MINTDDLKYRVFPGENVPPEVKRYHAKAYQLWRDVWLKAFKELGEDVKLLADGFSRQDEVGALFLKDECIALTLFHAVDFNEPTARHDSYFQFWTDADVERLQRDGKQVLICSNLTVSTEHRGELMPGLNTKVLILQLAIRRFLATAYPTASGAMRLARGAEKAAYAVGGQYLSTGKGLYGWDLDMVAFYRSELEKNPIMQKDTLAQSLWRKADVTENQTYLIKKAA